MTLTDELCQLDRQVVVITAVNEAADGELEITAEGSRLEHMHRHGTTYMRTNGRLLIIMFRLRLLTIMPLYKRLGMYLVMSCY